MPSPEAAAPPAADEADGVLSARLRRETRPDHAQVDAAFGCFDLTRPASYAAFLTAQARILPALEAALDPAALVPGWQGRTAALLQDLRDLQVPVPGADPVTLAPGASSRWGALYVLEGSRLGGAVLSRRVPAALPRAFLGAAHPPGAWRHWLALMDAANPSERAQGDAVGAAKAVFAAFVRSAAA